MHGVFSASTRWSSALLAPEAPYAEAEDPEQSGLDQWLLSAWGHAAPRLGSGLVRWRLNRLVRRVEAVEPKVAALPDSGLREEADGLRARLARDFDSVSVAYAFALAREASRRCCGLRHHRVQILAGAAMMQGALAEMQTGEGKTLAALLPAATAALAGRPVHVITVNDYLAKRDAEQLQSTYNALGISVGLVQHGQDSCERGAAYRRAVTYCTNKELVFDYLRDRLVLGQKRGRARRIVADLLRGNAAAGESLLLRGLHFAIVDEADSVMIDEAQTPLILSGPGEADMSEESYATALDFARQLEQGSEFRLLAGEGRLELTPLGEQRLTALTEGRKGWWAIRRAREELVQQALTALHIYHRDKQYIVHDDKVQIVDEFTGRVMPDRSWQRGLHQLIEAKEGCEITHRKNTLARITYQRFFRRYLHLCGMTGTAIEAANELRSIYALPVVRIPTHKPVRRSNYGTAMCGDAEQKWRAVVEGARATALAGRAVLIGTRSVGASEQVGSLLAEAGLDPVILNARQDGDEAMIVARAGEAGRVTVATNMAGRGTDIKPDPEVLKNGGLHVILTEFHESGRIDRQLFGRTGRQGDPGTFQSIVAVSDELFERFAGKRVLSMLRPSLQRSGRLARGGVAILRVLCQLRAERLHARARKSALAEDRRLQRALGFAGKAE